MNLPNKITISRIVLVVMMLCGLFVFSFFEGVNVPVYGLMDAKINLVYLIVCAVFIVASCTDFLDGYIARSRHLVTDLGKFLDPIADKMLVNSTLIFLAVPTFYAPSDAQLHLNVFVVVVFILRDLIVDTVRFMAAKKNIVIAANVFGKLKTIFQMIAIPIVLLNGFPFSYFDSNWIKGLRIADFFVYIALFFSVLSGVIYVYQNRKVFLTNFVSINDKKLNNVIEKFKENNLSLGSVESFTGGLFASCITRIPGVSKFYKGTIVSYSEEVKEQLVGVNNKTISEFTTVSKEVAEELARNGKEKLNVDVCVSFTGNAGPTQDKGEKPVGKYFIAIMWKTSCEVYEFDLKDSRENIQNKAINDALDIILKKF